MRRLAAGGRGVCRHCMQCIFHRLLAVRLIFQRATSWTARQYRRSSRAVRQSSWEPAGYRGPQGHVTGLRHSSVAELVATVTE